uniref:Uncharacterized protein n=1 Tax=Ipomoea trifida TaxID=35884 RepID=A0A905_IPOTF|nr:hypothetical protein [Ipomoea trifida]
MSRKSPAQRFRLATRFTSIYNHGLQSNPWLLIFHPTSVCNNNQTGKEGVLVPVPEITSHSSTPPHSLARMGNYFPFLSPSLFPRRFFEDEESLPRFLNYGNENKKNNTKILNC